MLLTNCFFRFCFIYSSKQQAEMRIYVCDICLRHLNTCIRVISNTLCFWINLSMCYSSKLCGSHALSHALSQKHWHKYIHIQFITSAPSIAIDLLWHQQQYNKISYGHQQIGSSNAFVRNTNTLRITRTHIYHQNTKPITNLGNSAKLCVHCIAYPLFHRVRKHLYTDRQRNVHTFRHSRKFWRFYCNVVVWSKFPQNDHF